MANTITLNGNYAYEQYRYNGGTADAIDATNATWIVANQGSDTNLYPFLVDNAKAGIELYGAAIEGEVSLTGEWLKLYKNSAAVMVRDTEDVDIFDMRISEAWDGIRIAGDSDGFEVSDVWISDVRDDAFENDNPVSGAISDSLFDGVFSGISLGHKNMSNAADEVLEIDGVLMRMESYLFKGEMTHQSPFKMESKSPMLRVTDTVIAIEDVDHIGQSRLQLAWDKMTESSGNVFLNLSNTPLPSDYPKPPSGWIVLEGQEARDYWDDARSDWIEGRGETDPDDQGIDLLSAQVQTETAFVEETEATAKIAAEPVDTADAFAGKVVLDSTIYTSLQAGPDGQPRILDKAHFEIAARADDVDDYIMYKFKTGELFYDPDGRGSEKQIKIAQLESHQRYDHSDFVVTGEAAPKVQPPQVWTAEEITTLNTLPGDSSDFTTIENFDPGTDKIVLDSFAFKALADQKGQVLDEVNFEVAARADDVDDHIMYKFKTGEVFYDPDGRGAQDQVKIAELDPYLSIDHIDFLIA
ncbi:MAG: hypothetical protein AAF088_21280 [Pseudomonadota bacterium]